MISSTGTPSIASLYDVCVSSFNRLFHLLQEPDCDFLSQLSETDLEEELGRFRVWAGNSGAHRNGRVSLDHKLREAYHVHQMVRDLLGDLDDALKEAISIVSHERKPFDEQSSSPGSSIYSLEDATTGDPEEQSDPTIELTELQERFGEVCHVITCLYKLSITIRNPAPRDRLQKCASIKISHFEFFDIQHAHEKFPGAPDFLQNRLGKANTKRRQLFRYHKKHHGKVAQYIDLSRPESFQTIQQGQEDEKSGGKGLKMTKNNDEDLSERRSRVGGGPSTIAETVNSQTTISTYVQSPSNQKIEVIDLDDSLSQTSYATSIGETRSTIHVPPPPGTANNLDGTPFECPYCYSIISMSSENSWIKHVYRDLRPYICTFENCLKPDRLFDTRHDWYSHEVETHRREWFCNTCHKALTNKALFESHLRESHPTLFTEAQIPAMAERCERAINLEQICPLCGEKHTSNRLKSHLARHMQQLALFTLPKRLDETDDHEGSLGAQASRSDEEEREDDLNEVELEFDSDPSQGSADNTLEAENEIPEEEKEIATAEIEESDSAKSPLERVKDSIDSAKPLYLETSSRADELKAEIMREIERLELSSSLVGAGDYDKALISAAGENHERLVEMLVEIGADVNAQGEEYGNALQGAAYRGNENTVQLLIERGADVNAQGGKYGNALQTAAYKGYEKIVQLLIERGADVNAQGGEYGNALQAAATEPNENTVQLLIERGADVNAQGGRYGNALQVAAYYGYEKIVQLLIERGADINAQGGEYGNALQAAAYMGNEKIVQLLIERGADVNAQGGKYGNALQAATYNGNEKIVQLLIERGADVNAQGGLYGNALQAAAYYGREKVVQLLVDRGANVNAQGGEYGNALQVAAREGNGEIVQLLIERGADVNAQGGEYGNALQAAAYMDNEKIVQLLIERGADVNAQGGGYGNALQAAAYKGNEKIVQLLIELGADVNAQGGDYGNALQAAAYKGNEKIVQLLIERGADVNAQGGECGNALQAAATEPNENTVQLLIERGADVNAQGGRYGNALQGATYYGREKIVQLLIERGADVNAQGGEYGNALQAAKERRLHSIVKLLLENGALEKPGKQK